jgi:hypothetical protein
MLLYLRARVHSRAGASVLALADLARVTALDAALIAPAKALEGRVQQLRAQKEAAFAAVDSCLVVSPRSTDCLKRRLRLEGLSGKCEAMEQDARKLSGFDPEDPEAMSAVANALFAQGAPWPSVEAALEARWAPLKKDDPARVEDEANVLQVRGDFAAARLKLQALHDAIPSGAPLIDHLRASFGLLRLLTEMGEDAAVVALARDVLDRAWAWTAETQQDLSAVALFAQVLFNHGAISREQLDKEIKRSHSTQRDWSEFDSRTSVATLTAIQTASRHAKPASISGDKSRSTSTSAVSQRS